MRWFRTNVRSSAWCALLIMALQLALTFGHVHLHISSVVPAPLAVRLPAPLPDASPSPTTPKPPATDDYCALCALIQMASAAAPAALLALPLPGFVAAAALTLGIAREPAASRSSPFQARGPPIA
jgi:hypothetical protein